MSNPITTLNIRSTKENLFQLKMLVATHKLAEMPKDDVYLPVHVGHAISGRDLGYQSDAEGVNISLKNESYCELTALYWAWKNLDSDVVGLSHYRRYFRGTETGPNGSRILSGVQMAELMAKSAVVLARPRNYVVETVESHYRNGHFGADLNVIRSVLTRQAPEYLSDFEAVMGRRRLSLYNMFIMRREQFDAFASWLFPILCESESLIDNSSRDAYQRRTFGYLGERLLNVWAQHHAATLRINYLPVVNTEGEPKLAKTARMLKRKLRSKSPDKMVHD